MQLRVLTWGEGTLPNALAMVLVTVLATSRALAQATVHDSPAAAVIRTSSSPSHQDIQFRIPAGALMDALDAFSEQSGLQIIYDQKVTAGRQALRGQRRDGAGARAGSSVCRSRARCGSSSTTRPCSFIAPRTARRRARSPMPR